MPREVEFAIKRYEVFLRDVIAPAVHSAAQQVEVAAWQWTDVKATPPTVNVAAKQAFSPVKIGWQWGPKWSTCWFRVQGVGHTGERPLHLRFSTATEGLVYERKPDGTYTILQGLDVNRDALLNRPVKSGERFEFLIEAACNHPFGVTGFEWDDPEVHARWRSETPGRLDRCEVAEWNAECERLAGMYRFAVGLLKELPLDDGRIAGLNAALREVTNVVRDCDMAGSAAGAVEILKRALADGAGGTASTCVAVGHAHIDTAWLWPLRETRRKCLRTFSNVLGLMERNPEFHFMCSQAQQYEYVEQDNPELFARIGEAVQRGQWEPVGGMWVEPDANCPSGESLIRQCLHGTRYWQAQYGDKGAQRVSFLPDTFGFPASLPGIMKHCGLDTFITNKLHWNSSNDFPHSTFDWKGIDGSVVLGHNTPGKDYNATMTPRELKRGGGIFELCHPPTADGLSGHNPSDAVPREWLQPFGYGDGGGGPTQWMIDNAGLAADAPGLPRSELGSVRAFVHGLHEKRAAMAAAGKQLPLVRGELYLELHRGTFTTQAWIKRANREAENALHAAEFVAFFGPLRPSQEESDAMMEELDRAWKLLLLNQFHDILPGSSIGWVYEDARRDFAEIEQICQSVRERAMRLWQGACSVGDDGKGTLVINPFDTSRSESTANGSGTIAIGPCSVAALRPARSSQRQVCSGDVSTISNGVVEVKLDEGGRIVGVVRPGLSFPDATLAKVLLNQLVMYEDRPHMWDAWDIDASYAEKPEWLNDSPCEREVVECTDQRIAVRFTRKIGAASRITQTISLSSGSARIDVDNEVEWHEDHRLLRALHAIESNAKDAVCGIQCGSVSRPLVAETPQDQAKFEFCAHGFVAVGEPGSGLAVLCPDKFGWSAKREGDRAVIGASLLRASTHPDPAADRGTHRFTYSLLPLLTAPVADHLMHEAAVLGTTPLLVAARQGNQGGVIADTSIDVSERSWAPFVISASCGARVRVMSTKRAEDDPDALIVRVHETAGTGGVLKIEWSLPVKDAQLVNGLEVPTEVASARLVWNAAERSIMCRVWPFGILAFRVKVDRSGSVTSPTAMQSGHPVK